MQVADNWKRAMARMIRLRPVRQFMVSGIRMIVPRHRIGVAVVVMDVEGRVLMLNHVFHPHAPWGLPGGWLSRKESPQACALRELEEETGLSAHLGPIVHVTRDPDMMGINLAFSADAIPGRIRLSNEILSAKWFMPDALPSPILPFTRDAVVAAFALRATKIELQEGVAG